MNANHLTSVDEEEFIQQAKNLITRAKQAGISATPPLLHSQEQSDTKPAKAEALETKLEGTKDSPPLPKSLVEKEESIKMFSTRASRTPEPPSSWDTKPNPPDAKMESEEKTGRVTSTKEPLDPLLSTDLHAPTKDVTTSIDLNPSVLASKPSRPPVTTQSSIDSVRQSLHPASEHSLP